MTECYIIGVSQYNTKKINKDYSILKLCGDLLDSALKDASTNLNRDNVEGLISMYPGAFSDDSIKDAPVSAYASYLSNKLNLENSTNKHFVVRTGYAGGATPVSLCLQAKDLINRDCGSNCIAIICAQTPNNINRKDYANLLNTTLSSSLKEIGIDINKVPNKSMFPAIPALYGAFTNSFLARYGKKYGITREHLAMIPCLMQRNAYYHSQSLSYKDDRKLRLTPKDIIKNGYIGIKNIRQMECARLADGGFSLIVANKKFIMDNNIDINRCFKIIGGSECKQSMKHSKYLKEGLQNYGYFKAINQCLINCNINKENIKNEIQYYGLYDCFPVVFIYGLLATGYCNIHNVAKFIENWYNDKDMIPPINTHGGLLAFGAPLSVPSGYCIVEAIQQLRNESNLICRQIEFDPKIQKPKAIIAGNGGILTFSAVMVIEKASNKLIPSRL